jgi:dTDP-4-amino-4,6-dideoxygalactose transaminase
MIRKTATDPKAYRNEMFFTNSARECWELILKTFKPNSKVLLPSYIGITDREGSGIYDPIKKLGLSHDFYLLKSDLSISIEEIERCLLKNKFDVILLVHYFGFKIQNIKAIVALCKIHSITVVEDCAHIFSYNISSHSDVGTFGDYAFYSLHKIFPLNEGGLLLQNNLKLKKPDNSKIQLNHDYSCKVVMYDLNGIVNKRIENFRFLEALIKNIDGIAPIKKLSDNDIPHNYPIIVANGLREKLYFWLSEREITLIALYYRLIEPITIENFQSMHKLSDSILNLPIHQDINKQDLINLSKLITEGITELNK